MGKCATVLTSCWALLLIGCSGAPDPQPATSIPTSPPPTKAVDVARYREHPCQIMPKTIDERFQLSNRKEALNQVVPPVKMSGSTCEAYRAPASVPDAILILYSEGQPASEVRSYQLPSAKAKPVSVRGFPAIAWQLTSADTPGGSPICIVFADFAGNQALAASFSLAAGDHGDVCGGAQQVLDLVLEKLVG
ncbi:DUF3558 family protein [Amycolatopsis sp. CA-230715]|uniref:DUF3558 family protein n=1 Tax=Amycolatopsis sp. CA-230715 TaxID=2745196 RepID=UPI0020B42CE5|nr:DUF3558 family protein [Amycolatopsis sp. CA-230715]